MHETSELMNHKEESRSKRLMLAVILGLLSAFGPLSLDMYLPALPNLADDLHTSASYAQLSLTACMVGLALGQIFAGPVSDMVGRKRPLIIGLILYCLISVACVVSPNVELFIMLRFIQGLAGAVGIVISRAVVRDLYSGTQLTKFFATLSLINGAAPILAPVFGGQLLAITSWRGVFLVLTFIGFLSLLLVMFSLQESLPADKRLNGGVFASFSRFGKIIKDRKFMGYALSQGFVGAAMFAYISGSPFVLQNIYGLSPQLFSVCFAINGIGIILGSQLTGKLSERIHEGTLLVGGLTIALVGGVTLFLSEIFHLGIWGVLIPLFLVVSAVGVVNTSTFSLAMASQGENAGSASALIGLMTFLLGGMAAPLVGIAGESSSWPMALIIAIAEILALVSYLFLVKGWIVKESKG